MHIFVHSHWDAGCRVLDVLEPLQALARNPDEKCVTVVQSGGDEGMEQLFSILGENGAEFGKVPGVVEVSPDR